MRHDTTDRMIYVRKLSGKPKKRAARAAKKSDNTTFLHEKREI